MLPKLTIGAGILLIPLCVVLSCGMLDVETDNFDEAVAEVTSMQIPDGDYLNYGLYWTGYKDTKQKFEPGIDNPYFDSNKPTVIYFHGWQQASSENGYAIVDFWPVKGDTWTHHGWLDQGWNVGIFHWAQWADEDDVQWAEAKIWSRNGPKQFRYRLFDGSYSSALNPSGNDAVGELAKDILVDALADLHSGQLRFVGHSLGNQLATRTAKLIFDDIINGSLDENTYKINRIALLEPAWTKNGKYYLGDSNGDGNDDWVGERCRWAIFDMMDYWSDLAVEVYNTTALDKQLGFAMDNNKPLRKRIAGGISVRPWYFGATQLSKKHSAAYYHYFWSMASDPPTECTISWWRRKPTGKAGPSAATPNWRILEMMGQTHKWDQVEGRYSPNPNDDWFERKRY